MTAADTRPPTVEGAGAGAGAYWEPWTFEVGDRVRISLGECDLIDGWRDAEGNRLPWNPDDPDGYPANLPLGGAKRITINGCIGHRIAEHGRTGRVLNDRAVEIKFKTEWWRGRSLMLSTLGSEPTRGHRFTVEFDERMPGGATVGHFAACELVPIDPSPEAARPGDEGVSR